MSFPNLDGHKTVNTSTRVVIEPKKKLSLMFAKIKDIIEQ